MSESLRFADSFCRECHGGVWAAAVRAAVAGSLGGASRGSGRGGDRAVADDRLAVHQHRGLPWRGSVEGLGELQLERRVATRRGGAQTGGKGVRVVAEPDVVDSGAVAMEDRVADMDAARLEVL